MPTLSDINESLGRVFYLFNQHYYDADLVEPVIAAQTNMHNPRSAGWCTTKKVWKNEREDQVYYEITVSSEFLYRDPSFVCGVLLHEMTHLYCLQNNIKDTSRGYTYHNKRFKEAAEKHGLTVEYDKRIGWSLTELSSESRALVSQAVDPDAFYLTREKHRLSDSDNDGADDTQADDGEAAEEKKKSSTRRYICPECKTIVRATKDVNIICGDCKVDFELEKD